MLNKNCSTVDNKLIQYEILDILKIYFIEKTCTSYLAMIFLNFICRTKLVIFTIKNLENIIVMCFLDNG